MVAGLIMHAFGRACAVPDAGDVAGQLPAA